jgi:hypothetical protein
MLERVLVVRTEFSVDQSSHTEMFGKNWKILVFFIGFSHFSTGNFTWSLDRSHGQTRTVSENLTTAVNSIIENVFLKLFTTVNVLSAVANPKEPYFLDFQDSLMAKNKGYCIYRLDSHTRIRTIRFRLKIYNAILLDSYKSFEVLFRHIVTTTFNFRGYYLFVLVNGKIPEIESIFKRMMAKKIINVNTIFEEDGVVKLTTFTPFRKKDCRNTKQVNHAKYIGNETFDVPFKQIFPDELKDMHGCEMKMAVFERCPASCILADGISVDGFDIRIVQAVQQALNFKLRPELLHGPEQWGNIAADNSTTGAISMILSGESDFTAGNFLLRSSRVAIMDPSVVYLSFPVVFAIPLGERLTAFEKLLRPFELVVWIMMVVFLGFGLLVIFVVNWKFKQVRNFVYGTGIKHPVVNMTIAVFGGTQVKLPRRNFARFILMMFLLFCLVQRNVYQGILYIFLQSDGRHKEVQSIKEMTNKKFQFYMYDSYTDIVKEQTEIYDK